MKLAIFSCVLPLSDGDLYSVWEIVFLVDTFCSCQFQKIAIFFYTQEMKFLAFSSPKSYASCCSEWVLKTAKFKKYRCLRFTCSLSFCTYILMAQLYHNCIYIYCILNTRRLHKRFFSVVPLEDLIILYILIRNSHC